MGDLRQRLKAAVDATPVPIGLQTRVQARLRERSLIGRRGAPRLPFFAFAGVAVCALLITIYFKGYLPVSYGPQASYIASVSNDLPNLMKVGLGDHIHCAVFRKYPKMPPAAELGSKFADLLPIVQSHIPANYSIKLAHECHYLGRKFIHVVVGDEQHLASLVITARDDGEIMKSTSAEAARYEISAFETGNYLVYFISDLPAERNAGLLASMATQVKAVLAATES